MQTHQVLLALGFASLTLGCAGAQKPPTALVARTDCAGLGADPAISALYSRAKVQHVAPVYRQEFVARAIQPRYVAGTELYVAAEAGLHPAYVERALTCRAAQGAGHDPNDPLLARGVADVDVSARGPSLRIAITGVDRASGNEIWRRASELAAPRGDVAVEQLAAQDSRPQL